MKAHHLCGAVAYIQPRPHPFKGFQRYEQIHIVAPAINDEEGFRPATSIALYGSRHELITGLQSLIDELKEGCE